MGGRIYVRSFKRKYGGVSEVMRSFGEYERVASGHSQIFCETTDMGVQNCISELANFGYTYDSCRKIGRKIYNTNDILEVKLVRDDSAKNIQKLTELEAKFFNDVYSFDKTDTKLEGIQSFPIWLGVLMGIAAFFLLFPLLIMIPAMGISMSDGGASCCFFGVILTVVSARFFLKRRKDVLAVRANNYKKMCIIAEYDESMKNILKEASLLLK